MCLSTISNSKLELAKAQKKVYGYKVVAIRKGRWEFECSRLGASLGIPRGKWLKAGGPKMIGTMYVTKIDNAGTIENIKFVSYPRGFHVYLSRKEAFGHINSYYSKKTVRVVKVEIKNIHTVGTQDGFRIAVCSYIRFPKHSARKSGS